MEQGRPAQRPGIATLAAWGGTGAMLATTALATVGTSLHHGPLDHWMWPATGIALGAFAVLAGVSTCLKPDRRVQALSAGGIVGSFIIPTLHETLGNDRFYQVDKWVGCFALGCGVAAGVARSVSRQ
jgi:hypothetical protein